MRYVLASASPRRKELLSLLGLPFEVRVSEIEEVFLETDPVLLTESLSRQKAEAVARLLETESQNTEALCVIGADTLVFVEDSQGGIEILGKPESRSDAAQMVRMIQGKAHTVCTGVTLIFLENGKNRTETFSERTRVYVAEMSEQEISTYLDTKEPYDKAGAYGIQGAFSKFIEKIEGDYYNVVGLPVHRLYQTIKEQLMSSSSE